MNSISTLFFLAYLTIRVESALDIPENDIQDISKISFTELCDYFNLPCERYEVTTEDGYLLSVHHIIGNGPPVLLWHGIADSSDTYILRGQNSTGANLAASGYDVWLGNSRGNKYSRKHVKFNPDTDKKEFWDFSFHEMGCYDMAATIDFILDKTEEDSLSAIGHSQGTTMFYVLASERPMYKEKIKLFISLAPIAYSYNIKGLLGDLMPLWSILSPLLALTGTYELVEANNKVIQRICTQETLGYKICAQGLLSSIAGNDTEQIRPDFFDFILKRFPAGASKKSFDHYSQINTKKRFAKFDYGVIRNIKKYGAVMPPHYDLKNVTTPVALLCGANDNISRLKDVDRLKSELPNVVYYKVMDNKKFNHVDFVWSRDINSTLNPLLFDLLKQKF